MEKLTTQEEEAMRAIWKTEGGFIGDFLREMDEPKPPYTTLASTIRNLVKKDYLCATRLGGSYFYRPLVDSTSYQNSFVRDFVGNYFRGSYRELVAFFVTEKNLDAKQLKEIIDLIENGKED